MCGYLVVFSILPVSHYPVSLIRVVRARSGFRNVIVILQTGVEAISGTIRFFFKEHLRC